MNPAPYLVIGISDFGSNVVERLRAQPPRYEADSIHFEIVQSADQVELDRAILSHKKMPVFILLKHDTPDNLMEALGKQLLEHDFVVLISDREVHYSWATSRIIVANEDEAFLAARLLLDIGAGPTMPALCFEDIEAVLDQKTIHFAQSPLSSLRTPDLSHTTGFVFGIYRDEEMGTGQLMQLAKKICDTANKDVLVRFSVLASSSTDRDSRKIIFLYD